MKIKKETLFMGVFLFLPYQIILKTTYNVSEVVKLNILEITMEQFKEYVPYILTTLASAGGAGLVIKFAKKIIIGIVAKLINSNTALEKATKELQETKETLEKAIEAIGLVENVKDQVNENNQLLNADLKTNLLLATNNPDLVANGVAKQVCDITKEVGVTLED